MSSITGNKGRAARAVNVSGRSTFRRAFVLPRFLRRPVRYSIALATGRVDISPHVGSVAAFAFLATTGIYGMTLGGHIHAVTQAVTTGVGFALEDVHVIGNAETSDIDILQQLGLDGSTSVVAIDAHAAREQLMELPWVTDAQVQKIYPRGMTVRLIEREPVGIWQHGDRLMLIDARGDVIAPLTGSRHAALPLYVGLGADRHADELEARLLFHPELRDRVKAAIRIADRRWDLRLDNGVTLSLPADDVGAALKRFAEFDAGRDVLSRDITVVDLRLEDRITLRLSEASFERRKNALEARAKLIKAGKKS
ncbi:cell division protein FtsQ/DivIB [Hoeflea sp. YIM 152468]|uniref:cell division protein FtsQ/DivIB n=1 Tax=Hoeflea sp. YIM 152468 TaxID=3031759 RepID=UPI0023DC3A2A|nr:cell division protein FtsQ/DivIB [Hoeflea sp. YIM 152468]MDF1609563.1 cell division protein FtsQ/DivIB [Hoeflea sp. YIM 152468]